LAGCIDSDGVQQPPEGFALLHFQTATDLIPDPIPDMGLLDDAMIVSLVLRRHEDAFKRSSHAYKLHWPLPTFEIDQLLSVVSPLRLDSFYSSSKSESICMGDLGELGGSSDLRLSLGENC
jgi:Protein of unknown function (DUF1232)